MTQVTREEIISAFGRSRRFPEGSREFELLVPFIEKAPTVVAERNLDDLVDVAGLADVVGRFLGSLKENDAFRAALAEAVSPITALCYVGFSRQLAEVAKDPAPMLAWQALTEAEAIEKQKIAGLNEEAKILYRRGELTFAMLLKTSPETFIPL
ncbi:MAG TPA: hypothetical protein VFZ58_04265 [Candidatus Saccharimonadales bacterium]